MPIAKKKHNEARHLSVVSAEGPDKYHALFEQSSDAIMTLTASSAVDEVNRAFEELTGFRKSECEGKPLSGICPKATHRLPSRTRGFSEDLLEAKGTFEDIAILRKDGQVRVVEMSVRTVKSGDSDLKLVIFRDVTERKKMERELLTKHAELKNAYVQLEKTNMELKATQNTLVQSGKMAALGELTAGIAHELNQPLQAIRGYAQELEAALKPQADTTVSMSLEEIISSVDKMAKIISYMRNFTRKSTEGYEWVSVPEIFNDAMKMMSRQFSSRGIALQVSGGETLPKIYANPVQIEQVLINLLSNARDAIEETKRGSGHITVAMRPNDKFVEIDVKDDGIGMSDVTKSKAFNPFFTTKEVGKGMGLGLSLSYGILNKIQGTITVESELGKGTMFTVKLPVDFRELG